MHDDGWLPDFQADKKSIGLLYVDAQIVNTGEGK